MWQKNGKGAEYKSQYLRDVKGERVFVLSTLKRDGTVHSVTFESWQMAKAVGWLKV